MEKFLTELGIKEVNSGAYDGDWIEKPGGKELISINPANGKEIACVIQADENDFERIVKKADEAFKTWRMIPAPKRGEIVRQIANELRKNKENLGKLVALEMGKIQPEGEGEVQEMIDIADFAVGLSRQLYGLTMHSERPLHRMYEQWHPLGVIGIISAFNFPVAVWAWNAMLAAVCGDTMIWKPSSKTPLCGIAVQNIIHDVLKRNDASGVMCMVVGSGRTIGEKLIGDKRIPLVSATGSTRMGKRIGEVVGARLGSCILELGGNNAVIVNEDADLDMATRAILFGAVGTAGQRCTSTRRVIVQESVADDLINRLKKAYTQVKIGDPLDKNTLMGPLIDQDAVDVMMNALDLINKEGGEIICGGKALTDGKYAGGFYVEPTIVIGSRSMQVIQDETFAPIVYIIKVKDVKEAIEVHNDVPQGLSSAMFTTNLLSAEKFLCHAGSDCGIANINIGTSGAEIGGAFGGEKETGGGREAGSDSWKAYMRRQTNTINWSPELPLAQGIKFGD
ncbi:MAG: aldehyde dehydrogenase family protein [candidate division Zixibacteria bacterium]|nr:aldehyde dehydrogenase family protein [candidate division Zixibacteria bacterium]